MDFYVYVHRYASGPKDGQVFYVGKGKGKRAWIPHGRSEYWNRIVRKYGYEIEILKSFESEVCAFSFEKVLIYLHGRENLCNMTNGGDGASGCEYTEIARMNKSISRTGPKNHMWGKTLTAEHKRKLSIPVKTGCGMNFYGGMDAVEWLRRNGHPKASQAAIWRCCHGLGKTAYGYRWSLA